MILATIDLFNFGDFYCISVKICVLDIICSAITRIAWLPSLKNDFWTRLMNFKYKQHLLVEDQESASK